MEVLAAKGATAEMRLLCAPIRKAANTRNMWGRPAVTAARVGMRLSAEPAGRLRCGTFSVSGYSLLLRLSPVEPAVPADSEERRARVSTVSLTALRVRKVPTLRK